MLGEALTSAGMVNYPTEWWHWSYGDRYWAFGTGAAHAVHDAAPDPQPSAADSDSASAAESPSNWACILRMAASHSSVDEAR